MQSKQLLCSHSTDKGTTLKHIPVAALDGDRRAPRRTLTSADDITKAAIIPLTTLITSFTAKGITSKAIRITRSILIKSTTL